MDYSNTSRNNRVIPSTNSCIEILRPAYITLTASNMSLYNGGDNIIYNTVNTSSDNIDYDSSTGEIKILESGLYFTTWWLTMNRTNDTTFFIAFSMKNQSGDVLSSAGISLGRTDPVEPFTIASNQLFRAQRNDTISLSNESAGPIMLVRELGVSSTLSLFRVSEVDL